MKTKTQLILMTFLVLLSGYSFGQGGALGNTRPAFGALPLGWTGGTPGVLNIRNDFANQPINFFTNSAQRMTILGGPVGGPTTGFLGINTPNPQSRLTVIGDASIGSNVAAPTPDGLRVFGRTYMGGNAAIARGVLHIDNSTPIFQLVLESSAPNNPDMTFADNTGVKGQIRYLMTGSRGLGFAANDANLTWLGLATEQIFINGTSGRIGLGNNIFNAQNRVEITSQVSDPYFGSINGSSGLRLTNLTASATPISPNPGLGVLSVDSNGDVIIVPDNSGVGNYCGITSNPLTSNFEIPLNNQNYDFTDPLGVLNDGVNFVKVGDVCGASLIAKLQIHRGITINSQFRVAATYSLNEDLAQGTAVTGYAFGVAGESKTSNNRVNAGIGGTASGGSVNAGGYFEVAASYGGGSLNNTNYGVQCIVRNGNGNIAVSGDASLGGIQNIGGSFKAANASGANYGIYAETDTTIVGNLAGYFVGDVVINGTLTSSDVTLKENIDSIQNADSLLNLLNPVYFNYKQTGNAERLNLPASQQMGLIAQEVEPILPNIVKDVIHPAKYDSTGVIVATSFTYKTIDYGKVIPLLVAGYKAQHSKIDSLVKENTNQDSINSSLQTQLNQLASSLNACCNAHSMQQSSNSNSVSQTNIELKNEPSIVLEQNVPNPFAEQTTINYNLTETTVKAQMLFYNAQGKLIQSVNLNEKGKGSLNVFASDLLNGIYTYTLVVDGKVFATKKMVKQ